MTSIKTCKRVIIVILCNVSIALTSDQHAINLTETTQRALVEFASICVPKVGATREDFLALHADPPYATKSACILKCLFMKVGLVKNGQFSKTGMMTALGPTMFRNKKKFIHLRNISETCDQEIKKSDPKTCDVANNVMQCLQDHAPELLFNKHLTMDKVNITNMNY